MRRARASLSNVPRHPSSPVSCAAAAGTGDTRGGRRGGGWRGSARGARGGGDVRESDSFFFRRRLSRVWGFILLGRRACVYITTSRARGYWDGKYLANNSSASARCLDGGWRAHLRFLSSAPLTMTRRRPAGGASTDESRGLCEAGGRGGGEEGHQPPLVCPLRARPLRALLSSFVRGVRGRIITYQWASAGE